MYLLRNFPRFALLLISLTNWSKLKSKDNWQSSVANWFNTNWLCAGLNTDVISKIQSTLTIKDLDQLREKLPGSDIVNQFDRLWELAKAYGYEDWIQFDASVVRGLAYYTGIVFEGFDRAGVLRAICGGGRYNRLLSTYGAKQDVPACGFGFGDCVIVELLKDRKLLPELPPCLDDIVIPFNEELRAAACQVAARLRAQGRSVDIILGKNKKIDWYEWTQTKTNFAGLTNMPIEFLLREPYL